MKQGDRLVICNPKHPHYTMAGTADVYESYFGGRKMGWRVNLDNGMRCYAAPHEIKITKSAKP